MSDAQDQIHLAMLMTSGVIVVLLLTEWDFPALVNVLAVLLLVLAAVNLVLLR